ncbi:cellulase family glycosylhydrolase [Catenuloplanes japonicus]|uniref:cellulase family glycosylhydrolase n=1 Tax=Catenuloplanes japonicus TaxID=33876 RepID=UPI0005265214|nr:cellulase family glycosylhydrolase [Catenuloplanes japonicus]
MRRMRALLTLIVLAGVALIATPAPASAAPLPGVFRDALGRELVLRGFNVSGSGKLRESGLLPFRSTADAVASAQAMRELTGATAIRFLISWEGVQPQPGVIDHAYLDRAAAQIRAFTDRGIRVLVDYHQDLWSRHLFDADSWYTGDGAPAWVIAGGDHPDESCGICLLWGQNMLSNQAVREAAHDFWANERGLQDAFLTQAGAAMRHLADTLPASSFALVLGMDPLNEPFDGGLDGMSGTTWEQQRLMPFYQRFRAVMDANGWAARPAFVEPLVFWNTTFGEAGGLSTVGTLGTRFVFNAHYYDGARLTLDPTPAGDGTYTAAMNRIRDRAAALGTTGFVSEFGNALSGTSSASRTPWMIRSMYQGLDSRLSGANWWRNAATAGPVLSATQWHWDVYSGRHAEAMNGNPSKILTTGDAWNDEDHSVISGTGALRLDPRVLDRVYPTAIAGEHLAFGYQDLARDGYGGAGGTAAWMTPPAGMPAVSALVGGRQYGVLVWRGTGLSAPTEVHLPASFAPARTAVVSTAAATVSSRLLSLSAGPSAGAVHVALVVSAPTGSLPTAAQTEAARAELNSWAAAQSWPMLR